MADFNKAIATILKHEGGYVNDPDDPGGETNMGITKRDFPHLDIINLTVEQAKEIYKENYWDTINGDDITNQTVATQIFDFGVNAGVKRSSLKVQEILDVGVDGIIGYQTITVLNSYNPEVFVYKFKLKRIEYYTQLARRMSLRKFLYAWIKRTIET